MNENKLQRTVDGERYSQYKEQLDAALGSFGGEHESYLKIKAWHITKIVRDHLTDPAQINIVEFGSGIGLMANQLTRTFPSIIGVDVDVAVIEEARRLFPHLNFTVYDGEGLPFADKAFDVAVTINVFHHIAPGLRLAAMQELCRVVRPGGLCIIAEHNPYNPLTRRVVKRCAFDHDAVLLPAAESKTLLRKSGAPPIVAKYVVFTPSSATRALWLENQLRRVPLGAQYIIAGQRIE